MSQTHNQIAMASATTTTGEPSGCQQEAQQCKIQDTEGKSASGVPECAVCLQNCIHPARLPCNHVFCYLCVKGVANQSKRCPMCRQEIPADFLEHPQLLEINESPRQIEVVDLEADDDDPSQGEYQWFYEGRNGWWQYDQRTNLELETAYKQKQQTCELLIAGFLYIVDFATMVQVRRNDHSRRRRIKRDLCNAPKKGIAGLRLNETASEHTGQQQAQQQQQQTVTDYNDVDVEQRVNSSDGTSTTDSALGPSSTIGTTASAATAADDGHLEQPGQDDDDTLILHQVLEQMRSLQGNLLTSTGQQNLQSSNDNNGSVLDYPTFSRFHRTSSNSCSSEEEHS